MGIKDCGFHVSLEQGLLAFWNGSPASVIKCFSTLVLNLAFRDKYKHIFLSEVNKKIQFEHYFSNNLASDNGTRITPCTMCTLLLLSIPMQQLTKVKVEMEAYPRVSMVTSLRTRNPMRLKTCAWGLSYLCLGFPKLPVGCLLYCKGNV